jgi:hypothetical protein
MARLGSGSRSFLPSFGDAKWIRLAFVMRQDSYHRHSHRPELSEELPLLHRRVSYNHDDLSTVLPKFRLSL